GFAACRFFRRAKTAPQRICPRGAGLDLRAAVPCAYNRRKTEIGSVRKMKALFIGGTGLISTAVSKLAIERGWDLTLFNRGQHIHGIPEGANIVTVDINDDEAVRRAMEGKHYDVIAQWIAFKPE